MKNALHNLLTIGALTAFLWPRSVDAQAGNTYSAVATAIAPAASATDIFTITGSGTKTARIARIEVSATQTTGGVVTVSLVKRSSADTGGTSSSVNAVASSSSSPAATATALSYSANPTLGTTVGTIRSTKLWAPATTVQPAVVVWIFEFQQEVLLRSTSEALAVNLGGITVSGGSFNVSTSWTEY